MFNALGRSLSIFLKDLFRTTVLKTRTTVIMSKKRQLDIKTFMSGTPKKKGPAVGKPADYTFGFGYRKPIDESKFQEFLANIIHSREENAGPIEEFEFNENRCRNINGVPVKSKPAYRGVSFWMFRDQRIDDNWALVKAQQIALEHKCPLYVTFFLMSHYSVAGKRQYDFMLTGLQEVEKRCDTLGIKFHLELGYAKDHIVEYCSDNNIDLVIADFCPLRNPLSWVNEAGEKLKEENKPLLQVDAHNIIPCWKLFHKHAFSARILRPHVHSNIKEYLTEYPAIIEHPYESEIKSEPVDWTKAWDFLKIDENVQPVTWAKPGYMNGLRMLYEFIEQRLSIYSKDRNDPTKFGLSHISPYLHFGQLSAQRAILEVSRPQVKNKFREGFDSFFEESVVRRELADNYCFYNQEYDNLNGAPDWSRLTLDLHRKDKREFIYTREQLENGKTHDNLWNAAQMQIVREGKMHGFMRMYWCKKILEWTRSPEEAIEFGCYLNDKYSLDGRDPSGYVGVMWSVAGVHDQGWGERAVFGKIRYMNYAGCKRKFDIDRYIKMYPPN